MRRLIEDKQGAELGKIIMSFPVLIGIFVVMGIFVFLSVAMANSREPKIPEVYTGFSYENFLLQEVEIGKRTDEEKIDEKTKTIFDILNDYKTGDNIDFTNLQILLERYLIDKGEDNTCIYVFKDSKDLGPWNLILRLRYYVNGGKKVVQIPSPNLLTGENLINIDYPRDVERVVFGGGFSVTPYLETYQEHTNELSYNIDDKEFILRYYFGKCLRGER